MWYQTLLRFNNFQFGIASYNAVLRRTYDTMSQVETIDDPKLVWSWYNDRQKKILAVKPNAGHIAIANLQSIC